MKQLMLFGNEMVFEQLTKLGDPLLKINQVIDWEMFRKPLEIAVRQVSYSKGGRPPKDVILMFKAIMLQEWYHLSHAALEFQITDRFSFRRFLGLEIGEKAPDENTFWVFREALGKDEIERKLFDLFNKMLDEKGIIKHDGTIVDASFVDVPKRRVLSDKEINEQSRKYSEVMQLSLENNDKQTNRQEQIDLDSRGAKKNNEYHEGYKDHVAVDAGSKIITDYDVTAANVHDSKVFVKFVDENTAIIYADSAYQAAEIRKELRKINPKIKIKICFRKYRNKPLTKYQKRKNREFSKIRCRVEHVFGYMTRSMGGMTSNVIGFVRNCRNIGLKNLGYNMQRFVTLSKILV